MRYDMTNTLFKEKSCYFRNALVRANYENPKLNVEKTQLPLEEFFKVLIYGNDIELRNRFLRIGYEYGTQKAEAVKDLHQDDVGINVGIKCNVVLSHTEENAVKAYFERCAFESPEAAYKKVTAEGDIRLRLGSDYVYKTPKGMENVPTVCIKVPSGSCEGRQKDYCAVHVTESDNAFTRTKENRVRLSQPVGCGIICRRNGETQ